MITNQLLYHLTKGARVLLFCGGNYSLYSLCFTPTDPLYTNLPPTSRPEKILALPAPVWLDWNHPWVTNSFLLHAGHTSQALPRRVLERVERIELSHYPWQGYRLPLHHTRKTWSPYEDLNLDRLLPKQPCYLITPYGDKTWRCVPGSNRWPLAWQASILTNWTNAP